MSSSTPSSLLGNRSVEEWLELESDPGVFSLLIEDYGVRGVKVEEIYDVSQNFKSRVFGFVFLFRYELSDRRARKKARDMADIESYVLDSEVINKMFFAHQIITNSCATHALLSVLLNCEDLDIGFNLKRLKEFTQGLDPESKGFAIANMMELAHIHNKHARPPRTIPPPVGGRKSLSVVSSAYALLPDTYHYVSFVPINGRLFELDGLKQYPINHGPWGEHEKWTDLFQRTVTQRLLESQDCLFNLMALVPDPVPEISECLRKLQSRQGELLEDAVSLAQKVLAKREYEKLISYRELSQDTGSEPASGMDGQEEEQCNKSVEKDVPEFSSLTDGLSIADKGTKPEISNTSLEDSGTETLEPTEATNQEEGASNTLHEEMKLEESTNQNDSMSDTKHTKQDISSQDAGMYLEEEKAEISPKEEPIDSIEPEAETQDEAGSLIEASSQGEVDLSNPKTDSNKKSETSLEEKVAMYNVDPTPLLREVSGALPEQLDVIADISLNDGLSLEDRLRVSVAKILKNYKEAESYKLKLKEEIETKQRFRIEHSRRVHDYDTFIFDFVKCLAHNKQLPERVLKRPPVVQAPGGNSGRRRKRKCGRLPKTTLILNGDEVL